MAIGVHVRQTLAATAIESLPKVRRLFADERSSSYPPPWLRMRSAVARPSPDPSARVAAKEALGPVPTRLRSGRCAKTGSLGRLHRCLEVTL